MILHGSDAHNGPYGLNEPTRRFLRADADVHVLVGDTFNLLEHGWRPFRHSKTRDEMLSLSEGKTVVLLEGNHDPREWLLEVFGGTHLIISRTDRLEYESAVVLHGHQFGGWWAFMANSPGTVSRLVPLYRKLTGQPPYTPGMFNPSKPETYNLLVWLVWAQALRYAQKVGKLVVIGHTHSPAKLLSGGALTPVLIDLGKMGHRMYAVVETKLEPWR